MKRLRIPYEQEVFSKDAIKNNIMMRGLFLSSTTKVAVHIGLNNENNMEILKCSNFENVGSLFTFTENVVTDSSSEIMNVSSLDS